MKKNLILSLSVLSTLLFSACSDRGRSPESQAETIIEKHTICYTTPPKRIPAPHSVDAPLLGNGFTGIALSGTPESQVFYVARNDFWRLKSALDESFPLVLGKIALNIPQLKDASYLVEQKLYNAVSTARFTKGDITVSYKAFVPATEDMLIVELNMEGSGSVEGSAGIFFLGKEEQIYAPPRERIFPDVRVHETKPNGIQYLSRAFVDSVDIPTKGAMALRVSGSTDGKFTLEPGKTVHLVCAFSSNFKSNDCVAAVIKKVEDFTPARQVAIEKSHKEWWRNYWEKSYVSISDSVIEKQYYLSLYGMGACSRDIDFPPSIFGTWITKERPYWNGDYHLNYTWPLIMRFILQIGLNKLIRIICLY